MWPAEEIWECVSPSVPGFTAEILAEIDSTNSELMRRARNGQLDPILLVAERQTAGRGRMGRTWRKEVDDLSFSIGLPLQIKDWSGLSLTVGVCLAQALHPAIRLKWPNDLWWQSRKLAGVLIETTTVGETRYAVIGVGINIGQQDAAGLSTPPAWLGELIPGIDAPAALLRTVPALFDGLGRFNAHGFAPFQAAFHALDALYGQSVTLSDASHGDARGVDARGALLVHTPTGVRHIDSTEVSVRPSRTMSSCSG